MSTTKEEIKQRVLDTKRRWLDSMFEQKVDKILEKVDLDKCEGNYIDAYPILAAILSECENWCLKGSCSFTITKKCTKLADEYKKELKFV